MNRLTAKSSVRLSAVRSAHGTGIATCRRTLARSRTCSGRRRSGTQSSPTWTTTSAPRWDSWLIPVCWHVWFLGPISLLSDFAWIAVYRAKYLCKFWLTSRICPNLCRHNVIRLKKLTVGRYRKCSFKTRHDHNKANWERSGCDSMGREVPQKSKDRGSCPLIRRFYYLPVVLKRKK